MTIFETYGIKMEPKDEHHPFHNPDGEQAKKVMELFTWIWDSTVYIVDESYCSDEVMEEAAHLYTMMTDYCIATVSYREENSGTLVKILIVEKGVARIKWVNDAGGVSFGSIG